MPLWKYNAQNCFWLGDTNFKLIPGYKENTARMLMLCCQRQVGMVQGSINWCDSFRPTAEFKHLWYKECQRKFSNETLVSDFFLIFFLIWMHQSREYQYRKKWSFHIYYFGEQKPKIILTSFLSSKLHVNIHWSFTLPWHVSIFLIFLNEENGSRFLK